MDECRQECKMAVELAIRRELAYRRKVLQSYTGSGQDLLPLEVPSTEPEFISSPGPSRKPNADPTPLLALPELKRAAPAALPELKRAAPVQHPDRAIVQGTELFPESQKSRDEDDWYYCETCKVRCCGVSNYQQHLRGSKHAKLNGPTSSGNDGDESASQKLRCGLCGVWCMNKYSLNQHMQGKKHKAEAWKSRCAMRASSSGARPRKWS